MFEHSSDKLVKYREVFIESCTKGEIYWNYPSGSSYVSYKSNLVSEEFEVCVKPALGQFQLYRRMDLNKTFNPSDYGDAGRSW